MWAVMFFLSLRKTQFDFNCEYLWAEAVFSMYLRKKLERKVFSYTCSVTQQDFSCLQVLTELVLSVSSFGNKIDFWFLLVLLWAVPGCENVPLFLWGWAAAALSYSTILREQSRIRLFFVQLVLLVAFGGNMTDLWTEGQKNNLEKGSGRKQEM